MVFQEAEYGLKFNFWGIICSIENHDGFNRFIDIKVDNDWGIY